MFVSHVILLCHVGEGPIPTALVIIVIILVCKGFYSATELLSQGHPYNYFPMGSDYIIIYIYILYIICLCHIRVVYVVKEVVSSPQRDSMEESLNSKKRNKILVLC